MGYDYKKILSKVNKKMAFQSQRIKKLERENQRLTSLSRSYGMDSIITKAYNSTLTAQMKLLELSVKEMKHKT